MEAEQENGFIPTSADQLRVGMFVWLDCPWYQHPFARNQFKIASEKEIDVIGGLGLAKIYVDPERSDDGPRKPAADAAAVPSSLDKLTRNALPGKTEQSENLKGSTQPQAVLRAANKAYVDVMGHTSEIMRSVSAGHKEGLESAQALVGGMVNLLVDEGMSLGMASLLNFKKMNRVHVVSSLNVCLLAMLVGRETNLDRDSLRLLGVGALLHDIGQEKLPSQLLYKTGVMTKAERTLFQLHPRYGKEMALQIPSFPAPCLQIIAQHHERLDGTGFPQGLKGTEISSFAQIVRVVDEYGYLINADDPAKRLVPAQALAYLYANRKGHYSEEVVASLIRVLSVYPPGTFVELSDGSVGVVVSINTQDRMRPWVALLESGRGKEQPDIISLAESRDLTINRSLQLTEFPTEVLESIDPAQIISYLLIEPTPRSTDAEVESPSQRQTGCYS